MTSKIAVLLVDDEPLVLDSLRLQIRRLGSSSLSIECADSVAEAWDVLEELHAEGVTVVLVVSDWLMPEVRGDAFLEQLRTRYPKIRRVLLTGQADNDALLRIRGGGLVELLLFKPWSEQNLRDLMELVDGDK